MSFLSCVNVVQLLLMFLCNSHPRLRLGLKMIQADVFVTDPNENFKMNAVAVETKARSVLHCGIICSMLEKESNDVCNSFFYNLQTKECYLQSERKSENTNSHGEIYTDVSNDWTYWKNENRGEDKFDNYDDYEDNEEVLSGTLVIANVSDIWFYDLKSRTTKAVRKLPAEISGDTVMLSLTYHARGKQLIWSTYEGISQTYIDTRPLKINVDQATKLTEDIAHNMAVDDDNNLLFYLMKTTIAKIMKMNLTSNKTEKFKDVCSTKINMAVDKRKRIVFFAEAGSCKQKLSFYNGKKEQYFEQDGDKVDIMHMFYENETVSWACGVYKSANEFQCHGFELPQLVALYSSYETNCLTRKPESMCIVGNNFFMSCRFDKHSEVRQLKRDEFEHDERDVNSYSVTSDTRVLLQIIP